MGWFVLGWLVANAGNRPATIIVQNPVQVVVTATPTPATNGRKAQGKKK